MAPPSRVRLVSPLRVWLIFNALFVILVASSWLSNHRVAVTENKKLVANQVETLTKARFGDLTNGRFRDFVEGIGREFGELYIVVDTGEETFRFGDITARRHCAKTVHRIDAPRTPGKISVEMCRPFEAVTSPFLIVLAAYLLIAAMSLSAVLRLDKRATATLAGFLRESGVTVDENQGLVGIMSEIRGIREQLDDAKAREKKLIASRAQAEIAEQVAHDIQSPLAALEAASADITQLPEEQRDHIRRSMERIRDITNDLLEKHRVIEAGTESDEAKGAATDATHCNAPELITGLIEPVLAEKRIQYRSRSGIVIEMEPGDSSYGAFARVAPAEFKRVVSNLVNNGIESLEEHSGTVRVGVASLDGRVDVTVRDTGKGIPQALLASLGKRGASYGKPGGSGLGLHHARNCAEVWGGRLDIASEPEKGTTVTLSLPQAAAPDWFVSELVATRGKPVVVLDDDESIHHVWRARWRGIEAGEQVIELLFFSTGGQLRSWVRDNLERTRDALFLLDYELTGARETGLKLAEELGLAGRAVLVTGRHEEPDIVDGCRRLGMPMVPKILVNCVPLRVREEAPTDAERWDAVLIDDAPLGRRTWEMTAKRAGKRLKCFSSAREFLETAKSIHPETPIYVDAKLSDGEDGLNESRRISRLGFQEVYLATGYETKKFKETSHLRGVVGKDPPWGA